MAVYNKDGAPVSSMTPIFVPLEHGDISSSGVTGNDLNYIATRFRSQFPLKVSANQTLTLTATKNAGHISQILVHEYDSSMDFIRYQAYSASVTLSSTTSYVRFVVQTDASGYDPCTIKVDYSGEARIVKNFLTASEYEKYVFEVSPDVYSTARLLLPPNYSEEGQKVPLMVYIHGSNIFCEWDSDMGELLDGSSILYLMKYLRDEGFAVLDVYGWTSKYKAIADTQTSGNKSNTFVVPITYRSYLTGIRYALSRYNLDSDNVSLYCKSLGGGLANTFAIRSDISPRAICELAPTVDVLFWGGYGQTVQSRTIIADQLGFTGNVSSVFLQSNFDWRSTNGKAFITANLDKMAGFNPGWNYNGQTLAEKLDDSYSQTYTRTGYCREVLYPIKIWVAPDDVNISYNKILEFVAQCQNYSEDITLRLMPENTGGHTSVDVSPTAPKSSGTTALGITYTDIPAAYVEMVEFIRSR